MALDLLAAVPASKIDSSDPAGYPYGKAQDTASPGAGTGTPRDAAIVNDILGFQQALLKGATPAIVPSGTPDKVGASQYLDALLSIITATAGGGGGFGANENPQSGNYTILLGDYGSANDVTVVYTGSGGDVFTQLTSASLTAQDSVFIEHRGTGILEVVFANASDRLGAVALGRTNIFLSPGEKFRFVLTGTSNVWNVS